jgi:tRNA nucleotidyltransferase/poly(A) polymerase
MSLPSLADRDWLRAPETRAVLKALGGEAGAIRVVGGAVRNALLNEPVGDVDMATVLTPERVVARAEAAGLKTVPTGIAHGTVTVIAGGTPFEVTTLRADISTDGRRATVRYTDDWTADARRRDFTMNALYCDADGTIFDPLGGYADVVARRVRFIGDPEARIREDYLRILRFFRFFAWYGGGRPDPEGLKACARLKKGLTILSVERVWAELKRLLSAPNPTRALLWMRTSGIWEKVLPESWGIDALPRLAATERARGWPPDPLLRLEALIPPHHARIDRLATRLRFANAERLRLLFWAGAPEADPRLSEADLTKRLYRFGPQGVRDRLVHALAREYEAGNADAAGALARQIAFAESWRRPVFPLSGRDLVAAGLAPGPELGRRLKALEERWVDSGFSLTPEALLSEPSV